MYKVLFGILKIWFLHNRAILLHTQNKIIKIVFWKYVDVMQKKKNWWKILNLIVECFINKYDEPWKRSILNITLFFVCSSKNVGENFLTFKVVLIGKYKYIINWKVLCSWNLFSMWFKTFSRISTFHPLT